MRELFAVIFVEKRNEEQIFKYRRGTIFILYFV